MKSPLSSVLFASLLGRSRSPVSHPQSASLAWAVAALALCLCLAPAPNASATLLLDEPFGYADGALEYNSFGAWANLSGSYFQILASSGQALLSHYSLPEEVLTVLPGVPSTNGDLYASFTVRCTEFPINGGTYFAQFHEAFGPSRARVFVNTNGAPAPATRWRVGIANAAATTTNYLANNLVLSNHYRLVIHYNAAAGIAKLWLDPTSEASPSVLATDASSPVTINSFALRQAPSTTNSVGVLQVDDLKIANSFPEVTAFWDNRWTTTNDSKWETPSQWSLSTPSISQTGPLIANAPSKTIIIDATTAWYYPSSLIVSNLTVSSPDSSTTNTLLLDKVGTNYPLVISNVFTLGSGGALTLFDSALHLPGLPSQPWGSPGFYVDGPVIVSTNASISASNVSLLAGNFSGSTKGTITLDDGSILGGKIVLGNADGAFGSLTMNAGLLTFPGGTNLFIGGASNAVGALTVNGGQLNASNSLVYVGAPGIGTLTANGGEIKPWALRVGQSGPGKLVVQGGSVEVADYVLIGSGDIGTVSVTGGQVVATNSTGEISVGGNSEGTLIVASNGVVVATSLNVATNDLPGHYARGTLEVQSGGLLVAGAHLAVGVSSGSTGLVTVAGGTISAPEIIVGLTNGSGTLNLTDGSVTASNLLVGLNSSGTGVVNVAAGTLTATDGLVQIGPAGSGQLNISGGNTIVTDLKLGGSKPGAEGVLQLTGGHLTVLSNLSANFIIIECGDLDGSGGTVIIGEDHDGSMEITCGAATNITTLFVGYTPGYSGTLTQDGGLVAVQGNVFIGQVVGPGALGTMTLSGGNFYVTNAAHTAVLDVRNGTVWLNNGAALTVDTLMVTNANGRFLKGGGVLTARSKVLSASLDADGDGLPNGWEQAHSFDPLSALGDDGAAGDPDHDGQSNFAEYQAGTDPRNAASLFRMTGATVSGQDVQVTWTTVGGHSYVVQVCTDATGGVSANFVDCSEVINVGGEGESTRSYTHVSGATNRGAYYRVRLGP